MAEIDYLITKDRTITFKKYDDGCRTASKTIMKSGRAETNHIKFSSINKGSWQFYQIIF